MPLNKDIKKVLVIGSGPIVIGQAAEFDYSGTQACEALKEEGVEVILINSNPATIMTDKEVAHKIYIEPLTIPFIEKVIEKERPDSLLAGVGGQTHGQHNRLRHPGSIGACSFPSRVFKGLRMAGRTGGNRVKVQNLKVLRVMSDQNLLVIAGSVPGAKNSFVIIEK